MPYSFAVNLQTPALIQNPVLPGFHPDPSVVRVGDDYYMATSTFEWFPGVPIYRSRDLAHWSLVGHALTRPSQLDLRGVEGSHGVWAPCLSHDAGRFYLVYTNVVGRSGNTFHLDNYLVTADAIDGPGAGWSEPVYLNSSGFDPSLFHDDDGRKWIVNLEWDERATGEGPADRPGGPEIPGPIVLQEFDPAAGKLVGPRTRIFRGATDMGCMEAPHLYKRDGLYHLMVAEGGTGFGHAVTTARAQAIEGPYENNPHNPVITATAEVFNERGVCDSTKPHRFNPAAPLQKAGHGCLVETPDGTPYVAHLCARPLPGGLSCLLGRETAIQRCVWTADGWLKHDADTAMPKLEVVGPGGEDVTGGAVVTPANEHDDFDAPMLDGKYQSLRVPITDDWASLTARPGHLRLRGRHAIFSNHTQSLIARRIQHFVCQAQTCVTFAPTNFLQSAGLSAFYDTRNFYFLRVYWSDGLHDGQGGRALGIVAGNNGERETWPDARVPLPGEGPVHLRATIDHDNLNFAWSLDGNTFTPIGPTLDAKRLSDEYGDQSFTGAFYALGCQDRDVAAATADFDHFAYREADAVHRS